MALQAMTRIKPRRPKTIPKKKYVNKLNPSLILIGERYPTSQ